MTVKFQRSPVYKRVILKLSGESLVGDRKHNIDPQMLARLSEEIRSVVDLGVQIGVVIGGGNFFRGKSLSEFGVERITADHIGMLGTLINALAMRETLERSGLATRIMSAIPMSGIVDYYDRRKAIYHLEHGTVVLFAAGTGNPLVTTDSAGSLRAIEVEADILLKATNVDGIYASDPKLNPAAKKFDQVSYKVALKQELGVMDLSAFVQCRDHGLPICVFNIQKPGALKNILLGNPEGTLVVCETKIK